MRAQGKGHGSDEAKKDGGSSAKLDDKAKDKADKAEDKEDLPPSALRASRSSTTTRFRFAPGAKVFLATWGQQVLNRMTHQGARGRCWSFSEGRSPPRDDDDGVGDRHARAGVHVRVALVAPERDDVAGREPVLLT